MFTPTCLTNFQKFKENFAHDSVKFHDGEVGGNMVFWDHALMVEMMNSAFVISFWP